MSEKPLPRGTFFGNLAAGNRIEPIICKRIVVFKFTHIIHYNELVTYIPKYTFIKRCLKLFSSFPN